MTILLGTTFALLLVAVVLSFQGMKDGMKNTPQDEIARMRSQIEQIRIEQDRISVEKEYREVRSNPVPQTAGPSEIEKMKEELSRKEAEIAALAQGKGDAEKKAQTFRDEAGLIGQRELEKGDNELRRARMIRDALLIGKVSTFVANPEVGNFITIEVVLPDHVQAGAILAIRRKTGILGRVKITEVTADGAIASPMPGFGQVDPQAGDELIIPPQF